MRGEEVFIFGFLMVAVFNNVGNAGNINPPIKAAWKPIKVFLIEVLKKNQAQILPKQN